MLPVPEEWNVPSAMSWMPKIRVSWKIHLDIKELEMVVKGNCGVAKLRTMFNLVRGKTQVRALENTKDVLSYVEHFSEDRVGHLQFCTAQAAMKPLKSSPKVPAARAENSWEPLL